MYHIFLDGGLKLNVLLYPNEQFGNHEAIQQHQLVDLPIP